jgi:adenylate cyclase
MPNPTLAVLFVDIVGSTELYDRLGDRLARQLVGRAFALMLENTVRHGGSLVKTIGDEILATFADVDQALDAVVAIQTAFDQGEVSKPGGDTVAVRAGCHFGPVLREREDVFGATVNIASRITQQAKGGQILFTEAVYTAVSPPWRQSARLLDRTHLQGLREQVPVYELLWQSQDVTSMRGDISGPDAMPRGSLLLRYAEQEWLVDADNPLISLGRSADNDIVQEGDLVSRRHAQILWHRGSVRIVDQSTNGSYITTDAGEELIVRRDTLTLLGAGHIGLGRVWPGDAVQSIGFQILSI